MVLDLETETKRFGFFKAILPQQNRNNLVEVAQTTLFFSFTKRQNNHWYHISTIA
jgi:hypothetical protein